MSIFVCCECPNPPDYEEGVDDPLPKYISKCGCPTATLECVSESKTATLCGEYEFEDPTADPPVSRSSPPKAYKKKEVETVEVFPADVWWDMGLGFYHLYNTEWSYSGATGTATYRASDTVRVSTATEKTITNKSTKTWNVEPCSFGTVNDTEIIEGGDVTITPIPDISGYNYQGGICAVTAPESIIGDTVPVVVPDNPTDDITNLEKIEVEYSFLSNGIEVSPYTYTSAKTDTIDYSSEEPEVTCGEETRTVINRPALPARYKTKTITTTLSEEDTDNDALDRATATDGTVCTSIYELRTTSFSFTVRTASYSVTANNLHKGHAYEGCVRLQRREAYSGTDPEGADTEWKDIEPDIIASFVATAKEMEIETDVALLGGTVDAIGYEYRAVSAHVWPVSAGCDCPTDYAAP